MGQLHRIVFKFIGQETLWSKFYTKPVEYYYTWLIQNRQLGDNAVLNIIR